MSDAFTEVLTWDAPRDEWLAARQSGIGSSDIAGVLGHSSWATPYSVWWSKVGQVEEREVDGPTAEMLRWGNLLEPLVAQVWSEDTGIAVSRIGLCRSNPRPWQLATADRLTGDGGVLECKTASAWMQDGWDTDTVPLKYLLQVTQQMDVLGVSHGYMAVLIGGSEFRTYEVPYDEEIVRMIRDAGEKFWKLVEDRTAPPTDAHKATTVALRTRWATVDEDATADLDWTWDERITHRERLKADIARLEIEKKAIDNQLVEALGAATHGVCGGQIIATRKARVDGVRVLNVIDSAKRKNLV